MFLSIKVKGLEKKAKTLLDSKQYDAASKLYKEIMTICERKNILAYAHALANIGIIEEEKGSPKNSIDYFIKALSSLQDEFGLEDIAIAPVCDYLARCYNQVENYILALEHGLRGLQIRENYLNPMDISLAVSMEIVATAYSALENYDLALEYCLRSFRIRKEQKEVEKNALAACCEMLVDIYRNKDDYANVVKQLKLATDIIETIPDTPAHRFAKLYDDLGVAYGIIEDYRHALGYEQKALNISQSLDVSLQLPLSIYFRIGKYAKGCDETGIALDHFQAFLDKAAENRVSWQLWAETWIAMGDIHCTTSSFYEYGSVYSEGKKILQFKQPNNWLSAVLCYKSAIATFKQEAPSDKEQIDALYARIEEAYIGAITRKWNSMPDFENTRFIDGFTDEKRLGGCDFDQVIDDIDGLPTNDLLDLAVLYAQLGNDILEKDGGNPSYIVNEGQSKFSGSTKKWYRAFENAQKIWDYILEVEYPKFISRYDVHKAQQGATAAVFSSDNERSKAAFALTILNKRRQEIGVLRDIRSVSLSKKDEPTTLKYGLIWLEVCALVHGEKHETTLESHVDIGWDYFRVANYVKAQYHFEYVLRCRARTIGIDHKDNEFVLKGLLRCARRLGLVKKAISYGELRIEITKKNTRMVGYLSETYTYMGALYLDLKDYNNAAKMLSAADKTGQISGEQNRIKALYFLAIGDHEKASKCAEAAVLSSKSLSSHFPELAIQAYEIMGRVHNAKGEHSAALGYFVKAFERYRKLPSPAQYDSENFYSHFIATILRCSKEVSEIDAAKYLSHAIAFVKARCISAFEIIDEESRYNYLQICRHIISLCNSYVVLHPTVFTNDDIISITLIMKNICAESTYLQMVELFGDSSDYRNAYQLWKRFKYEETLQYGGWHIDLINNELGSRMFDVEFKLIKRLDSISFKKWTDKSQLDNLLVSIGEDAALLEFGSFYYTDGNYVESGFMRDTIGLPHSDDFPRGRHYYVSVVTKYKIRTYYLHECDDIDKMVFELHNEILAEAEVSFTLRKIYGKLIQPLADDIAQIQRLYIAPEGELCILPFELLIDGSGGSLHDMFSSVNYLSTGRSLIRKERNKSLFESATIIANPEFTISQLNDYDMQNNIHDVVAIRDTRNLLTPDRIIPLPWTSVEAEQIKQVLSRNHVKKVSVFEKTKANKKNFSENADEIVHITSHGFAFNENDVEIQEGPLNNANRTVPLRLSKDPLLRCGLLFSGVCNALDGQLLSKDFGDGIITANEILSLDFTNTTMLVLSTCRGALGIIQTGEGIQGLRKAFEIAGVKSIVCSLWDVSDFVGMLIMKTFYEELFESSERNIAMALEKAKEYIKNVTYDDLCDLGFEEEINARISSRNADLTEISGESKLFAHPFYWAGFIVQGCQ